MADRKKIVRQCMELAKTKGTVENKVAQSRGRENYTFNDHRGLEINYEKSILGKSTEVAVERTEVRVESQGRLVLLANVRRKLSANAGPIEIKQYVEGNWEGMLNHYLGKTKPETSDPEYEQMSKQFNWA